MRARAAGAAVILITNAPRPSAGGGAPARAACMCRATAYDAIVSSGDVTRGVIESAAGPELCFISGPSATARSSPGSMCTSRRWRAPTTWSAPGSTTTRSRRRRIIARGWRPCSSASCSWSAAIPTWWWSAATRLVYCAGAIADLYAGMGGEVLYAGKPYRPIYDMALAKAETVRGRKAAASRVLAIGDSRAHRSRRRARRRRRFSVRDLRHSRRGTGRRASSPTACALKAARSPPPATMPKAVMRAVGVVKA